MLRRSVPLILSLAAAACATAPKATVSMPPVAGEVEAGRSVLSASNDETFVGDAPAASAPGRRVTLTLAAGGAASLSIDLLNGKPPVTHAGTWRVDGIDLVRVEFKPGASGKAEAPLLFFRDGLVLTAREWSRDEWGPDGLRLKVSPDAGKGR